MALPPDRELVRIPLDQIDPHPSNVRESLGHDEELAALADSIRSVGLLQPIIVQPKPDGRYEILAGHRRHAAMLLIPRLRTTMAVVQPAVSRAEALELMLVENLQRRALNPIEEAEAFQALRNYGSTLEQIAERCGVSLSQVSYRLSLLDLPADVQRAIALKQMNITRGYELAAEIRRARTRAPEAPRKRAPGIRYYRHAIPTFNRHHALASVAMANCARAGHLEQVRLGPACGPCWEATIRADERAQVLGREQAS